MAQKKIIPFLGVPGLIGIMLISLLALLAVQWYWVTNAVSLKEAEFDRHVQDAMNAVVHQLQDHDAAHVINHAFSDNSQWIEELARSGNPTAEVRVLSSDGNRDLAEEQENVAIQIVRPGRNADSTHQISMSYQYSIGNGENYREELRNRQEVTVIADSSAHGVYVQSGPGEAFIHAMVQKVLMRDINIHERLDAHSVDSLLAEQLQQRGIQEKFITEVVSEPGSPQEEGVRILTAGLTEEEYGARLFPRDLHPSHHHLVIQFPDRQPTTVRAMGLLLPTSGVLVLVVVLCFGLTLFALRRQKKLSEMKSDFINNMTHELKTPISTISLALQALDDPDMAAPGARERYTRIINEENERLRAHVERVLQTAALERGTMRLNFAEVDAHELIGDAVARTRFPVEERKGSIEYHPEATRPKLRADRIHFAGIVHNLLDNALKYSPEIPEITVRTHNRVGGFELTVQDRGQGMSREVQKRIFEKFYRETRGNVHNVKGFGLGLSYVQAMVRAHRGEISVDSELGKGATFKIFIPQNEA
ncbi:MAG: HAMP domain-containing sensor histidine kinase [Bacteroidota bacterium]